MRKEWNKEYEIYGFGINVKFSEDGKVLEFSWSTNRGGYGVKFIDNHISVFTEHSINDARFVVEEMIHGLSTEAEKIKMPDDIKQQIIELVTSYDYSEYNEWLPKRCKELGYSPKPWTPTPGLFNIKNLENE